MKNSCCGVNPLESVRGCSWERVLSKAMRAIHNPPLSAVFSPSVNSAFSFTPSVASKPEYSSAMHCALCSNSLLSSAVHQSWRLPSPSNFRPWSSNPWVNSCKIIAPMGAKFAASSACRSNSGGCKMAAGKVIELSCGSGRGERGGSPCPRLNAEAAGARSPLNRTRQNASHGASPHAE
jgi:hypothetical protein